MSKAIKRGLHTQALDRPQSQGNSMLRITATKTPMSSQVYTSETTQPKPNSVIKVNLENAETSEYDGGVSPLIESPQEFKRLNFDGYCAPRLTHYLFRFPAKFHPPVVHSLIRSYTKAGETILDPFCGSGTLMIAAAAEGRFSVGSDVDPVAVFVAKVKTHRLRSGHLQRSWYLLDRFLKPMARSINEYQNRRFVDISVDEYQSIISAGRLWTPAIPHLLHWFRRYVVIDLARIRAAIDNVDIPQTHRAFFRLIFASIIRNASNADPVPVSGLEVTAHMKNRDAAGRLVNPFELFGKAAEKGLSAIEAYWQASSPGLRTSVFQADARALNNRLRTPVDAIITSPPYHNAVDYYRRHQLEMYWLGFTQNHEERLDLIPRYIGRSSVRKRDPIFQEINDLGPLSTSWHEMINRVSSKRAYAFGHYMISMKAVFGQLAKILRTDSVNIFVVGHSEWNGTRLPTSDLFVELAGSSFELTERLWYPIKNRYMSYGRRNKADINAEHVLVFRRIDR